METDRIRRWIESNRMAGKPGRHEIELKPDKVFAGSGDPITGIVKFLGYYDDKYNIANFPSISFNTDFSMAMSACVYSEKTGMDSVVFDDTVNEKYTERAIKALNIFKNTYGIKGSFRFYIKRRKRYGEAKGLGESAAIASATARSIVRCAFHKDAVDDVPFVSSIARLVSGSGSRSVAGGVSFWNSYEGISPSESYAFRLPVDTSRFFFAALPAKLDYKTESAHKAAVRSPFYKAWEKFQLEKIEDIIDSNFDIVKMMKTAEKDALMMHAVLMSSGEIILSPETNAIINSLKEYRLKNEGLYYTMDTGPSIVIMSDQKNLIESFLSQIDRKYIWGKIPKRNRKAGMDKFMEEGNNYFDNEKFSH
ncbi:MAG: diphosphomevalonate/mevalonate 3,5-bisphosphate decarboxylase family protein [Thermoplasmata archaeon]